MSRVTSMVFEGWRGLPHSYCVWSTCQIAEIIRRGGVRVFFRDVAPAQAHWSRTTGVFAPEVEEAVNALSEPPPGLVPDLIVRTAWPYFLDPAEAGRVVVQATAEYGVVFDNFISLGGANVPLSKVDLPPNLTILTPSNWSREGFLRSGAPRDGVKVAALGVDLGVFRIPTQAQREAARAKHGYGRDEFVFLSIGAMTPNKNPMGIVRGFVEVSQKFPNARLLLKGADTVFNSKGELDKVFGRMSDGLRLAVMKKIRYVGDALTPEGMAALHHAADAYLAPYTAEGFCLPALEAAACGLPVIVTRGGPTDDFTTSGFAAYVSSKHKWSADRTYLLLEPDPASIVGAMNRVLADRAFVDGARKNGPAHAAKYSWGTNVDALLALAP